MRNLSLRLLKRKTPSVPKRFRSKVRKITHLLFEKYGTPSLGNFKDPVKEIFYIVLSAKTSERHYQEAHYRLRSRFPDVESIANAPLPQIRRCVEFAGLGNKRALQLKLIAKRLVADFGSQISREMHKLGAREAFEYLCSLPGIGPKSAFCVMMYSLGFDVFPVDTHVHRILARVGVIDDRLKHYQAQQRLPAIVPNGKSKQLHVALIVHGRKICTPRSPRCMACPIRSLCEFGISKIASTASQGR